MAQRLSMGMAALAIVNLCALELIKLSSSATFVQAWHL